MKHFAKISHRRTVVNTRRKVRYVRSLPMAGHMAPFTEPDSIRSWRESNDVELVIDLDLLAEHLGIKAACNKSGRSTAYHGLVKCRVLSTVKTDEAVTFIPLAKNHEIVG